MYAVVLIIHSWIRWIALVAGFGATLAALSEARPGTNSRAERWGFVLMMALDIQMLLGLLLYLVLSPITATARENFSAMLVAVVLAHAGRVLARGAKTPESKRIGLLVCFGIATFAMLLGTPWPGLANGRPLFRFQ